MGSFVSPPKTLVLITAGALVVTAFLAPIFLKPELPAAIAVSTKGQPTIGYQKAPVHIVVFEEPKCSNCRLFNQQIYPHLKENYIDTHKANYTVIPVSFLPGSMPAAIALLCVYHSDPLSPNADLYFSYLDYMYTHQPGETIDWATSQNLIKYASEVSPAISGASLEKCVQKQTFREKIEQNTDYGRQIMGGEIATPTVFINGVEVKDLDLDAIKDLIEEIEEHVRGTTPHDN